MSDTPTPQPPQPPQPPPHPRRPALKYNRDLAARFGIDPDAPTERETIRVDLATLPDPPGVNLMPPAPTTQAASATVASEDAITSILREEADEIAARLRFLGIEFDPACRQQLVDTAMALLAGVRPGGVIAGR